MCSLRDFSRALYPLAVRRRAPHLALAARYGVDVAAGGLHRQADGSRPCARSEISARALYPLAVRRRAPRISFVAGRATGSTSPPAACTGKLMDLGRVLAPRFQPCPLSVGGTAPSAALEAPRGGVFGIGDALLVLPHGSYLERSSKADLMRSLGRGMLAASIMSGGRLSSQSMR